MNNNQTDQTKKSCFFLILLTFAEVKSRPAGSGVVVEGRKKGKKKQKNQFDESNSENSGGVVFKLGHSVIL